MLVTVFAMLVLVHVHVRVLLYTRCTCIILLYMYMYIHREFANYLRVVQVMIPSRDLHYWLVMDDVSVNTMAELLLVLRAILRAHLEVCTCLQHRKIHMAHKTTLQ